MKQKSALAIFLLALVSIIPILVRAQTTTPEPIVIYSVAWSPDGTMIAGGGTDGFLRVWDIEGTIIFNLQGHTDEVFTVAWKRDGHMLASGGADNIVRIWNINDPNFSSGALVAELNGHVSYIDSLAWSLDGNTLISGSSLQGGSYLTAFVWDTNTYQQTNAFLTGGVGGLAWHPTNNDQVALADIASKVSVFDPAIDVSTSIYPFIPKETERGPSESGTSVSWHPDGELFAMGSDDGTIYIVNLSSNETISALYSSNTELGFWILGVQWNPSFTNLIAYISRDNLEIIDLDSQAIVETYPLSARIRQFSWSPDGRQLAYGGIGETPNIVEPSAIPNETPTPHP